MATTVTPKDAPAGPGPCRPRRRPRSPRRSRYRVKNRLLGPPARHRRARARAARHPDRARRLLVGLHLVVGVRDRGDPARAHPRGRRRRVQPRRRRSRSRCSSCSFFLILSYRETIKEYPTAGGAYMVTRDNFGLLPAQVAGVSLLTDYVLTVAVSTSAGTAALDLRGPGARAVQRRDLRRASSRCIAFGNLKGVRESGKIFAVPTYFFIVIMGVLLLIGRRTSSGSAAPRTSEPSTTRAPCKPGNVGDGLLLRRRRSASMLKAFASGGAAVTGVEAISNGVTAFKKPEWQNARRTLVIMGCTLGTLFLGLSFLATQGAPDPVHRGHADGHLPGRQAGVRRRRRRQRAVLRRCRPARC